MGASRRDDSADAALVALRRIVRYLRLADREIEQRCGISVAQLFVLHELADTPSLSIAEVAARTVTDPSSVSTVITRLSEAGLVTRTPSRTDRRRVELTVTPRGRQLLRSAPRVPQAAMIDAIRTMVPRRRAELVRALEALAGALGANTIAPSMLFEDEPSRASKRQRPSRRGPR